VALIQTTLLDKDGTTMNLGLSVDIVKATIEKASLVISQTNSHVPHVQGDGEIGIEDVDFLAPYDEPLLEYLEQVPDDTARMIRKIRIKSERRWFNHPDRIWKHTEGHHLLLWQQKASRNPH
jgi:acyl-CoA hydrolase